MGQLGDWSNDPDLVELAEDLADTLAFAPKTTASKGQSAVRRFDEFSGFLPSRLADAAPSHDMVDTVLAAYVNTRCGLTRSKPREWKSLPTCRASIRGEVGAIVGLLRLAGLLPANPSGTLPRLRQTIKKTKCDQRHEASPRAYTFAWELEAAWRLGHVRRDNPRMVIVWCMCVVSLYFLLRPKYTRLVIRAELPPVAHAGAFTLRWQRDDKGRPVGRPSAAPGLTVVPPSGIPASHPRLSAAGGDLLRTAMDILRTHVPPALRTSGSLLFCRVESARQSARVPKGAVAHPWTPPGGGAPVPAYWWPDTPITPTQWTNNMRTFLTPIVGHARAKMRVPSGFRGGGETELVGLGCSVAVRATIGWWRARRITAEGQLVVYESTAVEDMALETSFLGSMYIRPLAPGVYSHTPLPTASMRAIGARRRHADIHRAVVSRQHERERYFAARSAHAIAAATATSATSRRRGRDDGR